MNQSSLAIDQPAKAVVSKKIAIFRLSADPPTGVHGHLGIVKYLVSINKFDEIWIMPVYSHIYMNKQNLLSYDHRFKMCQSNFERCSDYSNKNNMTKPCNILVSSLEKSFYDSQYEMRSHHDSKKHERIGTIDLIRHIKHKGVATASDESHRLPDFESNIDDLSIDIHLVLGSDTFNDLMLDKWKDSERLLELVKIDVIERMTESAGSNSSAPSSCNERASEQTIQEIGDNKLTTINVPSKYQDKLGDTIFIHSIECIPELSDVSSTKVRTLLRKRPPSADWLSNLKWWFSCDIKLLKSALQPQVYQYIMNNDLYHDSLNESANFAAANDRSSSTPTKLS